MAGRGLRGGLNLRIDAGGGGKRQESSSKTSEGGSGRRPPSLAGGLNLNDINKPADLQKSYDFSDRGTLVLRTPEGDKLEIQNSGLAGTPQMAIDRKENLNVRENVVTLGVLGHGASGVVHKAVHVPTLRVVALKVIPVYDKTKRHSMVKEIQNLYKAQCLVDMGNTVTMKPGAAGGGLSGAAGAGVSLAEAARRAHAAGSGGGGAVATPTPGSGAYCPNIVHFYDAYVDPDRGNSVCIVVEFMDGGSLQDLADSGGCQDDDAMKNIAFNAFRGLAFLHGNHQLHRDIKPANLLINRRGDVKLSDFGIAQELEDTQDLASTFIGTVSYMSPERVAGNDYSYPSDVWAMGLSIVTCALGAHPYSTKNGYWGIVKQVRDAPSPTLPPDLFSPELCQLVAACLHKDPDQRPSAADVLAHPAFADIEADEDDLEFECSEEDRAAVEEELAEIVTRVVEYVNQPENRARQRRQLRKGGGSSSLGSTADLPLINPRAMARLARKMGLSQPTVTDAFAAELHRTAGQRGGGGGGGGGKRREGGGKRREAAPSPYDDDEFEDDDDGDNLGRLPNDGARRPMGGGGDPLASSVAPQWRRGK